MRAVVGSVVLHALLLWLVVSGGHEGAPRAITIEPATITMVEAVAVDLVPTAASDPGGGPAAGAAPHVAGRVTRSRGADHDPRGAITIEDARRGELRTDPRDITGALSTHPGAPGQGLFGEGAGRGGAGRGTGAGLGDGRAIERPALLAPPPAPRGDPPSKARPARLIYPSRHREVEDAELFVARVIVDADGFVAGARLVRGFGGRRDEVASQMIWRFRYAPALDDAGRPVRSTVEQRFLVGG